ncbi:HIT family protein [Nocardia tengchongensis]|uniref:HIT family protein n=1 Tax=Nocardia tengchongensis TaxID=2055889 RepID=UPI0036C47BAA
MLVILNVHYENIFDPPPEFGHAVHDVVRQVALAMRPIYGCDGVFTRQHDEPAGRQDVWRHHVHVLPRYHGDDLYAPARCRAMPLSNSGRSTDRLRQYFDSPPHAGAPT